MNTLTLVLKSRTFWTLVAVFIYNGLTSVVHELPNIAWLNEAVNSLGFILATYFHINPSQDYMAK